LIEIIFQKQSVLRSISFIDKRRDKEFVGLTENNMGKEYVDRKVYHEI